MEGVKGVTELMNSDYEIELLLYTPEYQNEFNSGIAEAIEVTSKELEQVGTFKSNASVLAVAKCRQNLPFDLNQGINLVLEDVRDPGNLGTIIRVADWYGISNILCSLECADLYNPKVINSTMGSFTRVNVWYHELQELLKLAKVPVVGTTLHGTNIYNVDLPQDALIVMGNESHGVSKEIEELFTHNVLIPGRGGAESLNVAIATAIVLDNFFR